MVVFLFDCALFFSYGRDILILDVDVNRPPPCRLPNVREWEHEWEVWRQVADPCDAILVSSFLVRLLSSVRSSWIRQRDK
jgi:hypothetical protein